MSVTITSYPLNQISYTISTPDTNYSNEIVKYLWIDISEATTDTYIEIVYNGVTTTLLITDECRYTPLDIAYQNKQGAIQILTFFKVKKDTISISSESYEGNRGHGFHQFVKFNVESKGKFSVNSGFVSEDRNEDIKQLLLSERVWLLDDGVEIPLNVASTSKEFKTRQNDRLINYEIEFDFAFNEINNV
jgi:hypothetical protein